LLVAIPIWRRNKDGDFSDVVDDSRVFDFVVQVREEHSVWSHEFELSQDIIQTLRKRFGHLTCEAIRWHRRLKVVPEANILRLLSGKTLRTALEKPDAWEHLLFSQVLVQGIGENEELRRHQQIGIALGSYNYVAQGDIQQWCKTRLAELQGLVAALDTWFNKDFQEAIGPPGQPGDMSQIVYCARGLSALHREAIEWAIRVSRSASHEEGVSRVVQKMTGLAEGLLATIEAIGPRMAEDLRAYFAGGSSTEPWKPSNITFTVDLPGIEDVVEEMKRLT
jgi:hypothetical protein